MESDSDSLVRQVDTTVAAHRRRVAALLRVRRQIVRSQVGKKQRRRTP